MPKIIEVVYTAGVLKPLEKIDLQEGETVEIEIKEKKPQKVISLRGIWKGVEISEEDIKKAKNIWEEGIKVKRVLIENKNISPIYDISFLPTNLKRSQPQFKES